MVFSIKQIMHPEALDDGSIPLSFSPKGNYATTIKWSNGHDSAIYSFDKILTTCKSKLS